MTFKGVKLKSEIFFSIFYGVLELWRKNPGGGGGFCPRPGWVLIQSLNFNKNYIITFRMIYSMSGFAEFSWVENFSDYY